MIQMGTTLLLFSLFLFGCLSLKQTQIGRNDWHLQNIGELAFAHVFQNKLFFLTHQNVLGHMRLESGQIESRITLSEHERLLSFNDRQVSFITENSQIVVYKVHNLQRQVNNRLVNDKILKSVKSYVHIEGGNKVIVNDQKSVKGYYFASQDETQQSKDIYTAGSNQILQKVFYFGNKLFVSMLRDLNIVIRQIINDQVSSKQINHQLSNLDANAGWTMEQSEQFSGSLVTLFYKQQLNAYQTVVLNKNFQQIFRVSKKYNQVIGDQLIFCSKVYNLKTKQQTQRLIFHRDSVLNIDYSIQDENDRVSILKGTQDYAYIEKQSSALKIKHLFAFEKSSFAFYVAIQYCDMTIEFYSVQNGKSRTLWTRQQGLAFIDKVLFMKYPFSDHLDNEYHRNLLAQTENKVGFAEKLVQVPSNIALRVRQQISDLLELVIKSVQSLLDFSKMAQFNMKDLSKFTMSEEQELKLGLKKYIVAVTKKGTIYSIDTKTNKVIWKKNRTASKQQVIALIDLRKDYELQAAVLITYNSAKKELIFQEITQNGAINLLDNIQCSSLPTVHKLNHESVIINIGDKTMRYQLGQSHAHQKHFHFYKQEEDRIIGYKQMDDSVVQIWNLNLDQGQKIISTASAYRGEQRSHIPLFDNGKVIFKNIDFTNLAVLTSKNATSLSLYILNGMTGQVHFNQFRSGLNLNHPVNLVFDQNNVIVTYYNNRNKLYEIWTVEEYQEKIETSAINMIKDYLKGEEYRPSRNRENIIFLSQVYGAPISIKKMYISESKDSLIRRNLVIITRDDKIYIIGREFVSTRRPKQTALFSNEVYPPYQYMIPFDATKFFSYNLRLYGLQSIHFSPSDMQSTIFVMAYGTDVYMIRVAPDNPFDMITEDFNYSVLVLIMIAVSLGVVILRSKAKNAKLIKPHRD